jgi:hypothetical protein
MVHESSALFDYILDHQTLPVNYSMVLAARNLVITVLRKKTAFVTRTELTIQDEDIKLGTNKVGEAQNSHRFQSSS